MHSFKIAWLLKATTPMFMKEGENNTSGANDVMSVVLIRLSSICRHQTSQGVYRSFQLSDIGVHRASCREE